MCAITKPMLAVKCEQPEELRFPVLTTPKGLQHVGPRAFGYDLDFKSVFTA